MFNYSDGSATELRMLKIVEQAQDVSSLSEEIERSVYDWASTYHFSRSRASLLRPLPIEHADSVLEIGAGCGAITRYLAETANSVLAYEGSALRAAVARARLRGLGNTEVVARAWTGDETNEKFDWAVLVGVLEYAGLYAAHPQPHLRMTREGGRWS
jgi:protein-L-isoaspartate O-methyltransferase